MFRKVIYGAILLIVLIITYNLVSQIVQAIKSGERLSEASDGVFKLQNQNKELKKKLTEMQSSDFIEQQARNKLGLSKKGETVVIIPEKTLNLVLGASSSAQPVRLSNPAGWWRVFFR